MRFRNRVAVFSLNYSRGGESYQLSAVSYQPKLPAGKDRSTNLKTCIQEGKLCEIWVVGGFEI
jgi:hypothetical protein